MTYRPGMVIRVAAAIALPVAAIGFAACSDDGGGSEEDEAAIQTVIDAVNQAQLNADAEAFLPHFTEKGLLEAFFVTADDVRAAPEEIIAIESEDNFIVANEIEIDGDAAEVSAQEAAYENPIESPYEIRFIKEDDAWLVDGFGAADAAEEPDGAETVSVTLNEFVIDFDDADLKSGSPIVFEVENAGAQAHHFVMFKLDEGVVLEEALQSEGEPEGVTEIGATAIFQPDDSATVVLAQDLEPGRYAFLCFLPDTRETDPASQAPHFTLGMVHEVTVE